MRVFFVFLVSIVIWGTASSGHAQELKNTPPVSEVYIGELGNSTKELVFKAFLLSQYDQRLQQTHDIIVSRGCPAAIEIADFFILSGESKQEWLLEYEYNDYPLESILDLDVQIRTNSPALVAAVDKIIAKDSTCLKKALDSDNHFLNHSAIKALSYPQDKDLFFKSIVKLRTSYVSPELAKTILNTGLDYFVKEPAMVHTALDLLLSPNADVREEAEIYLIIVTDRNSKRLEVEWLPSIIDEKPGASIRSQNGDMIADWQNWWSTARGSLWWDESIEISRDLKNKRDRLGINAKGRFIW